jgi:DNA polymerase-3 subunit delta'
MFTKLVGNEHVKRTLKHLLATGRVPNSLLFAGEDGVGKRQFALEVAKAFVCREPSGTDTCGICAACRRAGVFSFPKSDKGEDFDRVFFSEHPDVAMVIPFRRNIRIGSIRTLEHEANFRPFEAKARVFIVDEAEKMADPAANALLKTLEEPAPTTFIILITSKPDSLLPTIRSRCQTLRFAPVDTGAIETFLISERAFSHDEARLAARLSRGSIGRAVSADVGKFKVARDKMLAAITHVLENGDRTALLRIAEEMNDAKNKDNLEETLDTLQALIHDVWTVRTGADPDHVTNADLSDKIVRLAEEATNADLPGWLREIDMMRENFAVNINRKVATDALFVTMAGG